MMQELKKTDFYTEGLKGSETEKNLETALNGECRVNVKYRLYAEVAREQGLVDVAEIFTETADNEKAHAEIWLKCMNSYGNTEQNLLQAGEGEHYEWSEMYADFAETARKEGFSQIAALFEQVGSVEKYHEERFNMYREKLRGNKMFHSTSSETIWICLNCGYMVEGTEPPEACPTCRFPKSYFREKKNEMNA